MFLWSDSLVKNINDDTQKKKQNKKTEVAAHIRTQSRLDNLVFFFLLPLYLRLLLTPRKPSSHSCGVLVNKLLVNLNLTMGYFYNNKKNDGFLLYKAKH